MPTTDLAPYHIVHATDLRPGGGSAFEHALAIARDTGAVLSTFHASVDGQATRPMPQAATTLERWGDESTVEHRAIRHTCCDDPVDTTLDFLRGAQVDLLVISTRQIGGIRRLLHDSVSEAVARNIDTPTLFIPFQGGRFVDEERGAVALGSVVIPASNAAEAHAALHVLGGLARRAGWSGLDFVLLTVGETLPDELNLLPAASETPVRILHRQGPLVEVIAKVTRDLNAKLVAMPTRGHDSVWDMLAGSRTEQTLHTIPCPLLSIPVHD
ncbi:MAG: universal stress protein [Deltaproteobacteria bacterium]|nr:MAG: universal stress protein [Deltaproteobacteria bacterium]